MLAELHTGMDFETLLAEMKHLEQLMGDCKELRLQGTVRMDIDILQYGEERHHTCDWDRPYIKQLLHYAMKLWLILLMLTAPAVHTIARDKAGEVELLGKAIEYYQGGKYHESILAFEKLGRTYKLNPRFTAYLGMSYYKEMQYEEAAKYLKRCLPELQAYSPHEQAVYAYSCAESLFQLERYTEAIEYYEQALPLVSGNDRGDVLFHNAFAHYLTQGETPEVVRLFSEALSAYKADATNATSLQVARLKQTETMLRGMKK